MSDYDSVLETWFGPMDSGMSLPEYRQRWFTGGAAFDALLREKFSDKVEQAMSGELAEWEQTVRGTMALILLLDQLPRNLFRGTRRAFDGDSQAIRLAERLQQTGEIRLLSCDEKIFACMPYQHTEVLSDHEKSIELFRQLQQEAPAELQDFCRSSIDHAILHRDIIRRFGRFPHRNDALNRTITPEEQQWLDEGGERFGQ